jgi:hypothetical protein
MQVDYSYDNAQFTVKMLTALSALISILLLQAFVRAKRSKKITTPTLVKLTTFMIIVPFAIYLLGNFVINNFGGGWF